MSEMIYLYGFVPADVQPPPRLLGVADRPVELLDLGAFRAVYGRVPAELYSAEALEDRLRDLAWVGEQGVRHEVVVAWFVDHAQILPVRLLTLYSSLGALQQQASAHAERIAAQLRRFEHRREWDVKVACRRETLERELGSVSEAVAGLDAQIAAAAPGRRFLLQRKRGELVRTEASRAARRLGDELFEELRALAEDARLLPLAREAAELPVVLNAALLVHREAEPRLRARARQRADELAGVGVEVILSGPWAPYRFLEEADEGA